eukprot:727225-Pelagomonas_calceolata.AAC.7
MTFRRAFQHEILIFRQSNGKEESQRGIITFTRNDENLTFSDHSPGLLSPKKGSQFHPWTISTSTTCVRKHCAHNSVLAGTLFPTLIRAAPVRAR